MIKIATRQNRTGALLLRRFTTGNDQTRPHAVLDTHRVALSPQRDASPAYRDRPTALSIRFQNKRFNRLRAPKSP